MPRISIHRKAIAKHEPSGLYERILISKETFEKYKDVAKRRRLPKPKGYKVTPRPFNPLRAQESQDRIDRLALLARITSQLRLLDRLTSTVPLADRLTSPPPPTILDEHKPVPANLHFRRTKILLHVEEYNQLFGTVADRIDTFMGKVMEGTGITKEQRELTMKWGQEFDDLYHGLEARARKLTNKEWRIIHRSLKRIGKVSFHQLSTRLSEICDQLLAMDLQFNFGA